ncbi:uncharacterized protein LOC142231815 [Haematobia irritans]|uniref:uncharacterized protein LOC142231815 n=1 Tax=Haematobia irritans TaxID=7368 RepID=UPI003F4F9D72
MDNSHINALSSDSTIAPLQTITMEHNRRFVKKIINDFFDERKGTCDISSSQCSSLQLHSSEYSYDKRLKYWKDVVKDREKLTSKIQEKISKLPEDILYNRLSTIDERDRQTVKRIMDYAERMEPTKLMQKDISKLPEKYNSTTCQTIGKVLETKPLSERIGKTIVEISGLPKITKQELLGKARNQGSPKMNSWLKSKILERKIEEKREDIERVIEFYPDIDNLQIVGEGIFKNEMFQHDSQIELMLPANNICEISSESKEEGRICDETKISTKTKNESIVEYGLKVNEQTFIFDGDKKKYSKNFEIATRFSCHPFGKEIKLLLTLQNIGKKVLNFDWCHRSYYKRNSSLLQSHDNEFLFDNIPFRLCQGQTKEIKVLYQPRKVAVVKSKWILRVNPNFFDRKIDGIIMRLIGNCEPHPDYQKKLNKLQTNVIEKSKMKMMHNLTVGLGEITADLEPIEIACPYQRSLNDLEIFEQLNPGFKCQRYHDLQLLNDLYNRLKKPREKTWDLQVDSLKTMVLRVSNAQPRALYFNELSSILDNMKGKSLELEQKLLENPEKSKTRFLFVRGILCTSIDEWEDLIIKLEETFLKSLNQMANKSHQEEEEEEKDDINSLRNSMSNNELQQYPSLINQLKNLKSFHDSLYMQTYTLVCNITENIVNIIESTEVF